MGFRRATVLVITLLALVLAAAPVGGANAATLTLPAVTESGPPRSAVADAQAPRLCAGHEAALQPLMDDRRGHGSGPESQRLLG